MPGLQCVCYEIQEHLPLVLTQLTVMADTSVIYVFLLGIHCFIIVCLCICSSPI